MVFYVPLVGECILRIESKRHLAHGAFPLPRERLYRMNKGVNNNVKQSMSSLMESKNAMGTFTVWTETRCLFCQNILFMRTDFFYNNHAIPPLRGERGRRMMSTNNNRSFCPEFFMVQEILQNSTILRLIRCLRIIYSET